MPPFDFKNPLVSAPLYVALRPFNYACIPFFIPNFWTPLQGGQGAAPAGGGQGAAGGGAPSNAWTAEKK